MIGIPYMLAVQILSPQTTKDTFLSKRHKRKKCIRENNRNVFHSYFKSNLTQRGYRKRMIDLIEQVKDLLIKLE